MKPEDKDKILKANTANIIRKVKAGKPLSKQEIEIVQTEKSEPAAVTLTASELCEITGLTDRRHRQLADAGYFPAPSRGVYEAVPTMKGVGRYYREQIQKKTGTYNESKAREKAAKARLAEADADERDEKLLSVETVSATNSAILTAFVTRLCNFGDGIGNICHQQSAEFISERINASLRSALREVAKLPHVPPDEKKKTLQLLGFES